MRPLQCPEVPRRCTRCSTRRPCLICRGFPPCTTSESSTTVRRRECFQGRSRWGGSHCRTCARRTHWRPRRPKSSRWHRRGLRWGRYATGRLAGRHHSVCAKCFFSLPCTFHNFRYDKTWLNIVDFIIMICVSSELPSSLLTLFILSQLHTCMQ